MKLARLLFIAFALSALFLAPAAMAGEAQPDAEELVIPVLETEDGLPIEMTSSGKHSSNLRSLGMKGSSEKAVICENFSISCSNGTTDTCCGSVNSCLVYCGEVCGGPCVYEQ